MGNKQDQIIFCNVNYNQGKQLRLLSMSSASRIVCSELHDRIRIPTAGLAFGGTGRCPYRVRGVDSSCAKHLALESYAVIMLLTFILIISSLPSPTHSFIPGLKPSFYANPSHRSLFLLLQDGLHGFPGLFKDTSEHLVSYRIVPDFGCNVDGDVIQLSLRRYNKPARRNRAVDRA